MGLRQFKYLLRVLLHHLGQFRDRGLLPIFLFSTRRSGSTLLTNIIYSQPRFNYVDQPFDIWHYNPHVDNLPKFEDGQIIIGDSTEMSAVKNYFNAILSNKIVAQSQWNLFSSLYSKEWDCYIVSILNAKAAIRWFEQNFDAEIVYLTRHPVPTALSIMRLGWGLTAEAYLRNGAFLEEYVDAKARACARTVLDEGGVLEKHVVNWCLENVVPLRHWRQSSWHTVSYERLILEPIRMCRKLGAELGLPDTERMIEAATRPTRTTFSRASRQAIKSGKAASRVYGWLREVDDSVLANVQKVLDCFKVKLYRADEALPEYTFDWRAPGG